MGNGCSDKEASLECLTRHVRKDFAKVRGDSIAVPGKILYRCARCEKACHTSVEAEKCYDTHEERECVCCGSILKCSDNGVNYGPGTVLIEQIVCNFAPDSPSSVPLETPLSDRLECVICRDCLWNFMQNNKKYPVAKGISS
jgi:hypothetical protein